VDKVYSIDVEAYINKLCSGTTTSTFANSQLYVNSELTSPVTTRICLSIVYWRIVQAQEL
jgi:hypothetical protein